MSEANTVSASGKALLLDLSGRSELRVAGPCAAAELEKLLESPLPGIGGCFSAALKDAPEAVFSIFRMDTEDFFLSGIPERLDADYEKLRELLPHGIGVHDFTGRMARFALNGNSGADVLTRCGVSRDALPSCGHWNMVRIGEVKVILSASENGFEFCFNADNTELFRQQLVASAQIRTEAAE